MAIDLSLTTFQDVARLSDFVCSPDGRRLVVAVQTLSDDRNAYHSSLWEVPTDGGPPRRLTWSAQGEAAPLFLSDGSLAFLSTRPVPDGVEDDGIAHVWALPPSGGEARPVLAGEGGVLAMTAPTGRRAVVARLAVHRDAADLADDRRLEEERRAEGASGVLFDSYPIRWWSSALGPRAPRLVSVDVDDATPQARDLTGGVGQALFDVYGGGLAVTPDGDTVVTNWRRPHGRGFGSYDLVAVRDGAIRTLASGDDFFLPAISPDGRWVVAIRRRLTDGTSPEAWTLWLVELATGEGRDLLTGHDLWAAWPVWSPDSASVLFTADDRGRVPIFRVDVEGRDVTRVTADHSYRSLRPSPDGASVYALRSSMSEPETLVAVDLADGTSRPLAQPRSAVVVPGHVTQETSTADDGTTVHSWLVLPPHATEQRPAPLLVLLHGGPIGSWNAWSWRLNPHVFAEHGYAVLLPDPAQSTGYGSAFLARGLGSWGAEPYTDVLAAVDAVTARPEIDGARVAAAGASFGGYLVNWAAGHTDRFAALVSISGIWALDQMHGTSDSWLWNEREFGDPYADPSKFLASSPHRFVGRIRTPMLVVHGERDYRVPIDQALRLWTDLQRHEVPSRLLLFPDEGHFITGPGNERQLYGAILAFLAEHLG